MSENLSGPQILEAYRKVTERGESLHAMSPATGINCMCEDDSVAEALQKIVQHHGLSANLAHGPAAGSATNIDLGILIGVQMARDQAKAQQEVADLEEHFRMLKKQQDK